MSDCSAGGASVTMVVPAMGAVVVIIVLAGYPTGAPGTVSGVVVVVVVVTERVGAGGGGEETRCDSGAVAQPARRPTAPQQANTAVNRLAARRETEREGNIKFLIFMG